MLLRIVFVITLTAHHSTPFLATLPLPTFLLQLWSSLLLGMLVSVDAERPEHLSRLQEWNQPRDSYSPLWPRE